MHSTLLDRQRPLWELHLIEGLADGRFAIYFKVHHALLDGVSAQRLLQRILTKDPAARDLPPPWADRPAPRQQSTPPSPEEAVANLLRTARDVAGEVAGIPSALVRTVSRGLQTQSAPISFAAPRSIFNVPISGSRRFAAQSWPLERINRIRRGARCTINDVVLAACWVRCAPT